MRLFVLMALTMTSAAYKLSRWDLKGDFVVEIAAATLAETATSTLV